MTGAVQADPYMRPSRFEVACGVITGRVPTRTPRSAPGGSPLAVLFELIRPLLAKPPCLVAFSGGRDSSAVLAAAATVARQEGLPAPVPITRRFPDDPSTDEREWQELVVRHLGLRDWEVVDLSDMDLLGLAGREGLLRRGVLWPPLIHSWAALFDRARPGSLVTGEGGDEAFGPNRSRLAAAVLDRRLGTSRALAADAVRSALPRRLRRRWIDPMEGRDPCWLLPGAKAEIERRLLEDRLAEPYWRAGFLLDLPRRRSSAVGTHNMHCLAAEHDAVLSNPFLEPEFLAAVASAGPRLGYPDRTRAMSAVFGDLLPERLLARSGKIWFNRVVFGAATRRFAAEWDGHGVPTDLVDPWSLKQMWSGPDVHSASSLLLQQAWMASR